MTNAASTNEVAVVLTEQGHSVLATRLPRLELYAQSHGAPIVATGTAYAQAAAEFSALDPRVTA
ncbi:hypothetical protein ACFFWE_33380 [Sphaerisporangium melleum]|uniref:hypothetical protein n=1 Tax=Sphaerisporangium melleum TaxID=321316 RepID=UPI00166C883B|nr:hypothetical protein [Sphaerisporangium melleum]